MEKSKIKYPCYWSYRIIGSDRKQITNAIENLFEKLDYQLDFSNQSKTGKYTSLKLSLLVNDEEERNHVFNLLQNLPTVKFVL